MDQLSLESVVALGATQAAEEVEEHIRPPELIHQSGNVAIYRREDVGIKVILGSAPGNEKLIRLAQEKNISTFLPSSCNRREALCVQSFNGSPAMYFKWCHGVTLKQWLQNAKDKVGLEVNVDVRLRAAAAIAETLHEFHKCGVIYNNLLPENIVLDTLGENYVASFIDLSKAVFIHSDPLVLNEESAVASKAKDLHCLGLLLNELFVGEDSAVDGGSFDRYSILGDTYLLPTHTDNDNSRQKRGKHGILREGLPLYIAAIISSLNPKGNGRTLSPNLCYSSALDVFLDLKAVIGNPRNLLEKCQCNGRLQLKSDMFHGRNVEMSMLTQLFESVAGSGNRSMAVISGCPGSGKSALANQMRKQVEKSGFFIETKFSKSCRADMVLVSALNSFFGKIIKLGTQNKKTSIRWRIHDGIGSSSPLLDILPNLKKLMMGNSDNISSTDNTESLDGTRVKCSTQRLKILICKLIGALGCRSTPLIFFLDDLQWADDEMTLGIIEMIMTDPDISHSLLLGCYRDNEMKTTDPLILTLGELQKQGTNVVKVKVGLIEKDSVNSLVSEALSLPPSLCKSLSSVVHAKTGGIILFVLRLLTSLSEEGHLWFSKTSRRWEFNLDAISSAVISEDVVQYMTDRMARLPKQMRMALKIAACLGTSFPKEVMILAGNGLEFCMESVLDSCVDGGFLNEIGNSVCAWAHDQVQQAAYVLIPESQRESFHLLVGSRLFMSSSSSDIENFVFFIVDNMNRGLKLIEGPEQRYDVSYLNLIAGEKAMAASAFHSAVKYLMTGRELLDNDSWETKYALTMKIYGKLTESLFVTGDFSSMMGLIDKPLTHARCFEDKLNAYDNLVRAQSAMGLMREGIEKCLLVLNELGENFPEIITGEIYQGEVFKIKQLLEGKSHNELLALPIMTDARKLSAMKFMNHALSLTFIAKPILNPILVFRMIKMSIEYGVCSLSSFAFGCYGAWLVSTDIDGGYKMGRIATDLNKRLGAIDIVPRLYLVLNTFVNIWKEPLQATLSNHLEAYEIGSSVGDTEYCFSHLVQYSVKALYACGENLEGLAKNMQEYAKRAIQLKQMLAAKSIVVVIQLALELMAELPASSVGSEEDAYALYFGARESTVFALAHENNEKSICRFVCLKRKYVAFWSGNLDAAAQAYELSQEYLDGTTGKTIAVVIGTYIDGLIALYFARKNPLDKTKWLKVAEGVLETLKQWSLLSSWNFANKVHLLEAEYYFFIGDHDNAIISYEASIQAAKEHRFLHEEGLACEKAATFYLNRGSHEKALKYFLWAKKCYRLWGANALVNRMEKAIVMLAPMVGV